MKFFILSADATEACDPPLADLMRRAPEVVESVDRCDVVLVGVTRRSSFRFNTELERLNKPAVVFDMAEHGWTWNQAESHIWGHNTESFRTPDSAGFQTAEYMRFASWVRDVAKMQFVRELLAKDVSDKVQPLEYLVFDPPPSRESRGQFDARPISSFFTWGRSHERRVRVHAEMFSKSAQFGYEIISQLDHWERYAHENPRPPRPVWMSVYAPAYARVDCGRLQEFYARSRVSVALSGAGVKTFRQREITSSVIAMPQDKLAYTYEWLHGHNCIRLPEGTEIETIHGALTEWDLFTVYQNCLATLEKYRPHKYFRENVIPKIQKVL